MLHGASTVQQSLLDECGTGVFDEYTEPVPVGSRVHYSGNFWWCFTGMDQAASVSGMGPWEESTRSKSGTSVSQRRDSFPMH